MVASNMVGVRGKVVAPDLGLGYPERPQLGRRWPEKKGGAPWHATTAATTSRAFERTSKRRKGYPSETQVKRGVRVVHGDKELVEKLGRKDLCPCNSGRRFSRTVA
jgi:hypothetical protein